VIINNAKELFTFGKENLELNEEFTKVTFFSVKDGDIDSYNYSSLLMAVFTM
jgi:hypothetical protein